MSLLLDRFYQWLDPNIHLHHIRQNIRMLTFHIYQSQLNSFLFECYILLCVFINTKLTGFSRTSYISWISIHAWSCSSGDPLATCNGAWMPTLPWSPVFTFASGSITLAGFRSSTNTVKFTNTTIVTFTSLRSDYSLSFHGVWNFFGFKLCIENDPCLILDSDATGD